MISVCTTVRAGVAASSSEVRAAACSFRPLTNRAMEFYRQSAEIREREISRIMAESLKRFNHGACAKEYINLYEKMLDRPLVRN